MGPKYLCILWSHSYVARQLGLAIAIHSIATCLLLLLLLALLLLMHISMLMMLALTPMRLLEAFDVVAYAVVVDANANAKMPHVARHLASAYVVVLMLTLLPLLRELMILMMQC